jgi:hypothetical protein
MLNGVEVLEAEPGLDESTLIDTWNLAGITTDLPKLQLLRRELREIRALLV